MWCALLGVVTLSGATVADNERPTNERGGLPPPAGEPFGFIEDFESLLTLPTPLTGQTSTPSVYYGFKQPPQIDWLSNVMVAIGVVDLSGSPLGDTSAGGNGVVNDTQAMRFLTPPGVAQGLGAGAWFQQCDEPMTPSASTPVRYAASFYNDSLDVTGSIHAYACAPGAAATILFWGGVSVGDPDFPDGPIDRYWVYSTVDERFELPYAQAKFIDAAPVGHQVGAPVPVVVGSWHRIIVEIAAYSVVNVYIDYLDGQGEFRVLTLQNTGSPLLGSAQFNFATGFEGDAVYIDDLSLDGNRFIPPEPPPLACHYVDTLDTYPLNFQVADMGVSRWRALYTLSSFRTARILQGPDGPGDRSIFKSRYRSIAFQAYADTDLPAVQANEDGPWRFCVDVQTSIPQPFASIYTQHSIRLASSELTGVIPGEVVARVFLGLIPPGDVYNQGVFVQIDPDFPGPPNYAGRPAIGVDVVDTGVQWVHGPTHELCVSVDEDQTMRVYIDDESIYEGEAFGNSIDRVYFESAHTSSTSHDTIRIDNIRLWCPPCRGDANGDYVVDFADFSVVLAQYGQSGPGLGGDLNGDGVVDFADFSEVLARYGVACK